MAPRDDTRAQAMFAAYQGGMTLVEVAAQFGTSQSAVSRMFQRRQWPTRPKPPRDEVANRAAKTARHTARRDQVNALKVERGCADCGYRAHPAALQFDHLDGTTKRFRLASNLSRSWAEVEAEMAKCEVVCANCHAIRTAERGYTGRRPRASTG